MKKLTFLLVFLGLFSGFSANLLVHKPANAQVTKACTVQPVDSVSLPVPIDVNSDTPPEGGKYTARAYKMANGYSRYYVSDSGGTVSQVDLSYFKQIGVQKVRIKVCGRTQNNPNLPYLIFKFSNAVIRLKALGTQNLVYVIPKIGNTTTIRTVLEVEPPKR
jgi:hypothetical protein